MARLEIESGIISLYGSYKAFSQAIGVSVPLICQYVVGMDIPASDELKIINAAGPVRPKQASSA